MVAAVFTYLEESILPPDDSVIEMSAIGGEAGTIGDMRIQVLGILAFCASYVERAGVGLSVAIGAIAAMTFFTLSLSAVLRIIHNYLSFKGSKRLSKDLLSIDNLQNHISLSDVIDRLASLYVNSSYEMVVPLDLISEMTHIYKESSFEEAVEEYVESFLKKAKGNV